MRSVRRVLLAAAILGFGVSLSAQTPADSRPVQPKAYGTAHTSFVRVSGVAFFPGSSTVSYNTFGTGRYSFNGGNLGIFAAPLQLPAGARIVYLELDYEDGSASAAEYGSLERCDLSDNCTGYPSAGVGPGDCLTPGYLCSGTSATPGFSNVSVDLTSENLIVDNVNYAYTLRAGNLSLDGSTEILGMLVGYVLQVSPAPAVATFTDVPTNDFAFQFIEAFNSAGITAGCNASPAMYCPDRNVTRREMAVFFAKALGLQFP